MSSSKVRKDVSQLLSTESRAQEVILVNCISATQFKQLLESGKRLDVIDVRTPAEYQSVHVTIARNTPLDRLDPAAIQAARNGTAHEPLYVVCRSGARGRQACERFIAAGFNNVINVEGGTTACEFAGIDVVKGKWAMPINCQVQVIVGTLVIAGSALSYLNPMWAWLPGVMGAGLLFSGLTDSCVMGMFLARMPWNAVRTA